MTVVSLIPEPDQTFAGQCTCSRLSVLAYIFYTGVLHLWTYSEKPVCLQGTLPCPSHLYDAAPVSPTKNKIRTTHIYIHDTEICCDNQKFLQKCMMLAFHMCFNLYSGLGWTTKYIYTYIYECIQACAHAHTRTDIHNAEVVTLNKPQQIYSRFMPIHHHLHLPFNFTLLLNLKHCQWITMNQSQFTDS